SWQGKGSSTRSRSTVAGSRSTRRATGSSPRRAGPRPPGRRATGRSQTRRPDVVTWIVGLAGAGKTTVGRALVSRLRAAGRPTALLDGDAVRAAFDDDLGHDLSGRRANGRRIAGLCQLLESQGIEVVACVLAVDPDQLARNRATFDHYVEVFLEV